MRGRRRNLRAVRSEHARAASRRVCRLPCGAARSHRHRTSGIQIVRTPTSGTCADAIASNTTSSPFTPRDAGHGAVTGNEGFTPEILALTRQFHPEAVDRPPIRFRRAKPYGNAERLRRVPSDRRQNADGSVGNCTACHGDMSRRHGSRTR